MPGTSSDWFSDPGLLLAELRRERHARAGKPQIDGYDDVQEVHRGGQGIVYSATQLSTKRRVAIKLLREGIYASATERRRFEREIDLAAALRHPHIVQVYDSGVARDGRHYCIMEYVPGAAIDEFVGRTLRGAKGASSDGDRDTRALLALFEKVADAVNYAHQRGVIHRDLKPSNIRVDPEGEPRVLDFGLAKASGSLGPDNPTVALSVTGQFMGSLPWASPEQVRGEPLDVRSDVYSLGVVLFQLLTGKFPYPIGSNLRDTADSILNAEPLRPSAISRGLDADVDTIVRTCLAKDAAHRYQTVGDLARDLRHYLAGEPIEARRDSAWYTLRKTVRRYQLAAIMGLIIFATLATGFVFSLVFWRDAVLARDKSQAAELHAQRRFEDVRRMASSFIFEVHDRVEPLTGSTPVRQFIIEKALGYLDRLAAESGDNESLLNDLSGAYVKVGDVQGGLPVSNVGDTAGAMRSYRAALALAQRWRKLDGNSPDAGYRIANCWDRIGNQSAGLGDSAAALEAYENSRHELEQVLPRFGDTLLVRRSIAGIYSKTGSIYLNSGETERGMKTLEQSLALMRTLAAQEPNNKSCVRDQTVPMMKIAQQLCYIHREADAMKYLDEAMGIFTKLAAEDPNDMLRQRDISVCADLIGTVEISRGRLDAAEQIYRRGLEIARRMVAADPRNVLVQRDLMVGLNNMGDVLRRLGRAAESEAVHREALAIAHTLITLDRASALYRWDASFARRRIAETLQVQKRYAEAAEEWRRASDTTEMLRRLDPHDGKLLGNLALEQTGMAEALRLWCSGADAPPKEERDRLLRQARDLYCSAAQLLAPPQADGTPFPGSLDDIQQLDRVAGVCDALLAEPAAPVEPRPAAPVPSATAGDPAQ
ncbi:MAG: serine/threonine-protein kinase [Phycisphaerae bacterium]